MLDDGSTCTANVAQATDTARSMLESLPALSLNLTAYEAMTVPEQLFVIANVERVARGVPPIAGLTAQLDTIAQTGADNNTDPSLNASSLTGGAVIVSGGANWAGGTSNPLGTNYYWMYDDGPNSPNGDCTSPGAPGCWGHRDNILGGYATASLCSSYGLSGAQDVMGAGFTANGSAYGPSFAEILIGACGAAPTDVVFTWQQALQLLGGGTGGTVPGPPQSLAAATSTTHGVVLTWNAPAADGGSAVTGYELLRGKVSGKERDLKVVSLRHRDLHLPQQRNDSWNDVLLRGGSDQCRGNGTALEPGVGSRSIGGRSSAGIPADLGVTRLGAHLDLVDERDDVHPRADGHAAHRAPRCWSTRRSPGAG